MDEIFELREQFSVCQFFADGSNEYVCRFVDVVEALTTFRRCCHSVGARIGTTTRVIITDMLDCTNAEWRHGQGITYPPKPN